MISENKKIKKRGERQGTFFAALIIVLLVGIVSFLVVSNLRITHKRSELLGRIEELNKEIQDLETKKQELQAGIIQTKSEVYWEEKLREQGYKKPGEESVVVLPPEEQTEEIIEEEGLWQKIVDFFKRD